MSDERDTLAATKLTRTEFAVVRAYAQGMRPLEIANRYLLDPDDDDELTEHQAIQRILSLRDRLVQFALQHDRPDIAEMFEALRGRSDTGMSRRVEALSSIEQLGQGRPLPSHRVSLWFGPSLARRLSAANIHTIADLVALANRRGSGWWRHVPRIGQKSCETIVRWLSAQQATFDIELREFVQAHADFMTRAPLLGASLWHGMRVPVPLESMRPSAGNSAHEMELAEELGTVKAWIRSKESSPNTWKSYRREAERVLLWVARQGRSLRSLTAADLVAYQSFLANPQPADFWCGPSSARDKAHWRPFEGPLRTSSCEASLRVVRALLGALHHDVPRRRARRPRDTAGQVKLNVIAANPALSGETLLTDVDLVASEGAYTASPNPVSRFLNWLANDAPAPQQRAALAAALLIARHGLRVVELPELRFAHLARGLNTVSLTLAAKNAARAGDMELGAEVWHALAMHWRDRGIEWEGHVSGGIADAALLAPIGFPETKRGRAKRSEKSAGYSASGLDRLLRSSWRRFAAVHDDVSAGFTPRQLRLA
ncbi:phage integrase family protein [Cupriavidus pauculus]|uniref:Recombinase XerD n=1 Tax=Cupriavidus pauculus TaxID=82633 RepID=A0A2N5C7L0_9BURK|nr:phage integrase family protein [Cupriavidus pauculus]PLP98205.1 recombinase XerD [Cupriavidus pauculus]